jgi:hypothetical protein
LTIELPPWLGALAALFVCGGAFWRGGRDERLAAAGVLLSLSATFLWADKSWPHVQKAEFAADTLLLLLLLWVALRSSRWWPMSAAGFQLLAVMTHVAKAIDPGLQQWAYITAGVIWTYLLLAALAVGTWNASRAGGQPASAAVPGTAARR